MEEDEIARQIVDAAVKLHMRLGPGLLESVYQVLLARDLRERGLEVETERPVDFTFEGISFERAFRVDLLVGRKVVVELKACDALDRVFWRQVLTYLKLMDLRVGLLINFGAPTLKAGLHRVVHRYRPPQTSGDASGS